MAENKFIAVYVVEDDRDIREGLAKMLDQAPEMLCVGTASDGENAVREILSVRPDIVLMDIELPGMSGITCVRKIRERQPQIDIMMLTVHDDDKFVFEALCAGACGYLLKGTKFERILAAIKEGYRGGAPMSTRVARRVVESFRNPGNFCLTEREQDVLNLLCNGKSYKDIASRLFVTADTVRTHIKNIYRKLEVHSKSQAVAKAFRENFIH